MKRSEIAELSDYKLWTSFYWMAVKVTNEANSRRGLTKVTHQQELWFADEICKRFGWDKEKMLKELGADF